MAAKSPDMRFDPALTGSKTMAEAYPLLANYDVLGNEDYDEICRYAAYMVDPGSPAYEVMDIDARKKRCMKLAGVKSRTAKYDIEEDGDITNHAVTQYLSIVNNDLFTLWLSIKTAYYHQAAMVRRPVSHDSKNPVKDQKDKLALAKAMREDREIIEDLENALFKNDYVRNRANAASSAGMVNWAEEYADPPGTVGWADEDEE